MMLRQRRILNETALTRWRVHTHNHNALSGIIIVSIFFIIIMTSSSPSSSLQYLCHALASPCPWNSRLYSTWKASTERPTTKTSSSSSSTTTSLNSATVNGDVSASESAATTATSATTKAGEVVVNGVQDNNNDHEVEEEDVHLKTSEVLSLDSIRASLIRQEETIIFALIERAQFRQNLVVYQPDGLGRLGTPPGSSKKKKQTTATTTIVVNGEDDGRVAGVDEDASSNDTDDMDESLSFLEYMLIGTEALHCAVRRYMSPEEHAFFPERLPTRKKILPDLDFPSLLSDVGDASELNFNEVLLRKYIDTIVPSICQPGDDEQHGSTALCDVALLQALSKRVHYGKFVAESKYLGDPDGYRRLVHNNDAEGVMRLLTNEAVEAKVLRRARLKAATYGTEPLLADLPPLVGERERTSLVAAAAASAVVAAIEAMGDDSRDGHKVCPSTVESIYRDIVIPLTKDIEVAYLFRRCGKDPPPQFGPDRMSTDVNDEIATAAAAAP